MVEYRIISIGTLAAHPLWDERQPVRTGHATTTLISSGDAHILVDPSLPAQALLARLTERANIMPERITHVFLTSLEPERRRAMTAFEHAKWLAHEPEIEGSKHALQQRLDDAASGGDQELIDYCKNELAILERCEPASDSLAEQVDLFPLPGRTPGTCGLLLPLPGLTVLIAGDAVATSEHLEQGKVLPDCIDVEQAQESFREAVEIADIIVPGRDNLLMNPLRRTV